jgi:hypothetical protein
MTRRIIALIGAAACTGLIVIFIPGFAREIAAGVTPSSEIQTGIEDGSLVISPPDATCSHNPWPYGCDWRAPIGRKQIAKKIRNRHHPYALTTVRNNRSAVGD